MSRRRSWRLGALALIGVIAAACGPQATGVELYEQQCAGCHAADGTGSGGSLGSGSTAVGAADGELTEVIRRGRNAMPGFPRLSQEQIDSLVVYIRELQADG